MADVDELLGPGEGSMGGVSAGSATSGSSGVVVPPSGDGTGRRSFGWTDLLWALMDSALTKLSGGVSVDSPGGALGGTGGSVATRYRYGDGVESMAQEDGMEDSLAGVLVPEEERREEGDVLGSLGQLAYDPSPFAAE